MVPFQLIRIFNFMPLHMSTPLHFTGKYFSPPHLFHSSGYSIRILQSFHHEYKYELEDVIG